MGLLLMTVVSFERYFVISKAAGQGNLDTFKKVQSDIKKETLIVAIAACDKQKVQLQMQLNRH
jgi:biopolymer transport protein ExbB